MLRHVLLAWVTVSVTAVAVASGTSNRAEARGPGQATPRVHLVGVWKVTEQASRVPGGAWTAATTPDQSLYIFTKEHYSYMYTLGSGPRRRFAGDPNQPTDAEKVDAYGSFVAASGTYTFAGSALNLNATLHKNPNEMGADPVRYTVEVTADTLQMTVVNPPFDPGRERRTVLTRME